MTRYVRRNQHHNIQGFICGMLIKLLVALAYVGMQMLIYGQIGSLLVVLRVQRASSKILVTGSQWDVSAAPLLTSSKARGMHLENKEFSLDFVT